MSEHENRDIYIAAGVFGLALVILWAIYQNQPAPSNTDQTAAATTPAVTGVDAPPLADATPYNYNVTPYDPGPPINFGSLLPSTGQAGNGCCNSCGPSGQNQFNNVNVQQFATLLGNGNG